MPTANVYYKNWGNTGSLNVPKLQTYLASKLSCGDIKLRPDEVSVRIIAAKDESAMLGNIEVDITAHAFPDRVKNQDIICADLKEWLRKEALISDPRVWLQLCQLGHDVLPQEQIAEVATKPAGMDKQGIILLARQFTPRVRKVFEYLSAFAPYPATFDAKEFATTTRQADPVAVLERFADASLITRHPDGKYSIPKEVKEVAQDFWNEQQ